MDTNLLNTNDERSLPDLVAMLNMSSAAIHSTHGEPLQRFLTSDQLIHFWGLTTEDYDALIEDGLPTIRLASGASRHPVRVTNEWVKRIVNCPPLKPTPCRLIIDVDALVATLDGRPFALKDSRHELLLLFLTNANGNWCSGTEITKSHILLDGERCDRIVNGLPSTIKRLIQAKSGCGYRIVL